MAPELIVWDFDGVLNRNVMDGRFVWADKLDVDHGLSRDSLQQFIFHSGRIAKIMRGQEDLRDVVAEWLDRENAGIGSDELLAYWFAKDSLTDNAVLQSLLTHPARQVIGTNNEARRAAYIETDMGFGQVVEAVFASGRMGVAKPDPAFFESITDWAGVSPAATLLVDDSEKNVIAAHELGWQTFHFTDETRPNLHTVLYP